MMEDDELLFSSFRLAVPLASPKRRGDDVDRWILDLLALASLVRTMNRQHNNPQDHASAWRHRSRQRVMRSQVAIATRSASGLEAAFSALAAAQRQCGVDDARMRGYHEAMQKLQVDTRAVCETFQTWLENNPDDTRPRRPGALRRIFVLPETDTSEDSKEDYLDEFEFEDGGEANDTSSPSSTRQSQHDPSLEKQRQTSDLDAVEIQREQQEMLEAELASMATRLKSSTMAMNATLKTQTKDLDSMEELAQTNLDRVSDTAKKVEDRLKRKKGWKKTLATWSLIGTVVGVWVLCFMVMRTLPKRKVQSLDIGGAVGGLLRRVDSYFSGRPELWEDETPEEESERDAHEQQVLKERLARERERKREERNSRRRQHHHNPRDDQRRAGGECQVQPDGVQVCTPSSANDGGRANVEGIKALNMAAEQKRRRIRENMENPQAVHAVDSANAGREDGDPVGCVPWTDAMRRLEVRLGGLSRTIADSRLAQESAEDSEEWIRHSMLGKIQREQADVVQSMKAERNRARDVFWTPERQADAGRAGRTLESIPFCKEDSKASLDRDETEHEWKLDEQARAEREAQMAEKESIEQAKREATRREARREAEQMEADRLERQRLEAERLEAEQFEAEGFERQRLEEERIAAQEAAQTDADRIERERDRLEEEAREKERKRVVREEAEAVRRKAEEDNARIEKERLRKLEGQRRRAEAAEKEAEAKREAERLAAEEAARAAKIEAERLEEERARRAEQERLVLIETERLEKERIEQEREFAEQRRKDDEARRLSAINDQAKEGAGLALEQANGIELVEGSSPAGLRMAARNLENGLLARYLAESPGLVDSSDRSNWRAVHEAARAGNLVGLQLLIEAGADLNSMTGRKENGGTALWWALQRFGEDGDVVQLLRMNGAVEKGPTNLT